MTHTKTAESIRQQRFLSHYLVRCPFCKNELVISTPNLSKELELYKPREETYVYWQGGTDEAHKRIGKQMISSDPSKDEVKIHCCYCGHVWNELADDVRKGKCDWKGDNTMKFELSEKETEKARAFEEEHIKRCCVSSAAPFTAMGMQFTYTITPGGLGPIVSVKCNVCGETENITCTEGW